MKDSESERQIYRRTLIILCLYVCRRGCQYLLRINKGDFLIGFPVPCYKKIRERKRQLKVEGFLIPRTPPVSKSFFHHTVVKDFSRVLSTGYDRLDFGLEWYREPRTLAYRECLETKRGNILSFPQLKCRY